MAFGKFIQGLAGNFSEQNKETLIKEIWTISTRK